MTTATAAATPETQTANTAAAAQARQLAEYLRALDRAHAEGLYIIGRGVRKLDGAPVVCVTSASDAIAAYPVAVLPGRLECPCKARGICKHRALVREDIERDHFARLNAAADRALERIEKLNAALSAAEASSASTAEWQRQRDRREAAPLGRDNRPFSIWKQ